MIDNAAIECAKQYVIKIKNVPTGNIPNVLHLQWNT